MKFPDNSSESPTNMADQPLVSIIIPCLNEQETIRYLLEAITCQTYPKERMEVVIADGLSTDNTRAVIESFQHENPQPLIRVVDNQLRNIPAGLNQAIRYANGEIIVRMDAHSIPQSDYVERSVRALEAGFGSNVGGVWEIKPGKPGITAQAIAIAAAHPLSVGDARYRYTNQAGVVDTVPFGAFYRSLIETIGFYDDSLLTNEDYELNVRIVKSGGKIWLDPAIRSTYFSRSTYRDLLRQYWRYGYWKVKMLVRYPGTIRWRQALPPLFVASLFLLAFLAPFFSPLRWLLLAEVLVYAGVYLLVGIQSAIRNRSAGLILAVPLAIFCMHLAWGAAFLWSSFEAILETTKK